MFVDRFIVVAAVACALAGDQPRMREASAASTMTLDDVLRHRRSVRSFSERPVSMDAFARLCWAAQGITEPVSGKRTAPSAGALYPLELYVVEPGGLHRYSPHANALARIGDGDRRAALASASLGQDAVRGAGGAIVITAVLGRTRAKYGDRAERFAHLEAGHAAQNVLLEATSLGLGSLPVGAFDDDAVRRVVGASTDETPLYVVVLGDVR